MQIKCGDKTSSLARLGTVVNMKLYDYLLQNKKLVILVTLFFILLPLGFSRIPYPTNNFIEKTSLSPTVSQLQNTTQETTPTMLIPTTQIVDDDPHSKLLDLIQNRRQLSDADSTAKKNLLLQLPNGESSGNIYLSSTIRVEYVRGPDLFQVEILTTNVALAKVEAAAWFQQNGISQEGICNLPVSFYLNWDIAQKLRNSDTVFNPLPNDC